MKTCIIKNNNLVKSCNEQKSICYDNKCYKIDRMVSNDKNAFGDVYAIDNENMIVKVNKKNMNAHAFQKEIKIQEYVSQHDLCPKIYQHYSADQKHYIIMENLLIQGYDTWHNIFINKTVPAKAIKKLYECIKKLHKIGVSHNDLHANNIFYNKTKNQIKFIDFGLSIMHDSKKLAIINEVWSKVYGLTKYKGPWSVVNNSVIELYKSTQVKINVSLMLYHEYCNDDKIKINNAIKDLKKYFEEFKSTFIKLMYIYKICRRLKNAGPDKKNELMTFVNNNKQYVDFLIMCNKVEGISFYSQLVVYQNK